MRRFNPGLVIRMVLGSKSKGISDLLLFSGESGEEDTGGSASEDLPNTSTSISQNIQLHMLKLRPTNINSGNTNEATLKM